MIQGEDKASKIDIAIAWYKQGRCPCCGKSLGEPRGLEYRVRLWDLYCHACRRCWPIEVDLTALRDELSFLESAQADIPSAPASRDSIPATMRPGFSSAFLTSLQTKPSSRSARIIECSRHPRRWFCIP